MIRRLAIGVGAIALVAGGILISRTPARNVESVAPVSNAVPAAPATPAATGVPEKPRSRVTDVGSTAAELESLETRALESLPTIAAIRKKTNEEVHATPPEILESGRRFGELAEFLARHPDLVRAALPTYVRCAEDASVVTATRALCAFRLHVYEKDWDDATRASFAKLPSDVHSIAKQLEGTE